MPPSQLKRLKSSLREQGITGPQKHKNHKTASPKNGQTPNRIHRNVALQQIRDSCNPFEFRQSSRPVKFESASLGSANSKAKKYKDVLSRPGVSKSAGEEMRRRDLLPEIQRRKKTGGLVDRRIGENDPGLSLEEKALQRFAREKSAKTSLFDLEGIDEDEPAVRLTHFGRSIDDFDEELDIAPNSDIGESDDHGFMKRKRQPTEDAAGEEEEEVSETQPERKKTKKEVMEEIIAKSKLHKYERQKAKEDDDELRDELDSGMADMLALLRGHQPASQSQQTPELGQAQLGPTMNPDRLKLLEPIARAQADKEYEMRLRQLAQDTRAKPAERTKTEEEKAAAEREKLQELEAKRLKRMHGEQLSDGENENEEAFTAAGHTNDDDVDEAADFGFLSRANVVKNDDDKLTLEDEDDFALDEDLIASGSDLDVSDNESDSSGARSDVPEDNIGEEDEFVREFLDQTTDGANGTEARYSAAALSEPSFTYDCPQSHADFIKITENVKVEQVPTVVQRIRALHHPSLSATNKASMAVFSTVLVDHIAYMASNKCDIKIIEQLVRHLHSLSRTYPTEIAEAFRKHLQAFHRRGRPNAGDLSILTAIGSIYPTSDHFHPVVTPAMTLMARWLGLNLPDDAEKDRVGGFLVSLCASYQRLAKRFVPEAISFTLKALSVTNATAQVSLEIHLQNLMSLADLWKGKSAFPAVFEQAVPILRACNAKQQLKHLEILLQQARQTTRPLESHHHKPQAIRSSVPKFEEDFNPDKHYDPDKDRSDAKKLQKEHKRELKGALRELRKDANFIAREQLREKKIRDAEYEKKQRRLIAEIQGEEAHEAKNYEREKRKRKAAR